MAETIAQRELRNNNAAIMRRVEQGESFVVTIRGKPVADVSPHRGPEADGTKRITLAEAQELFRKLPPVDVAQWYRDRDADDEFFGDEDPLEDPWERAERRKRKER